MAKLSVKYYIGQLFNR